MVICVYRYTDTCSRSNITVPHAEYNCTFSNAVTVIKHCLISEQQRLLIGHENGSVSLLQTGMCVKIFGFVKLKMLEILRVVFSLHQYSVTQDRVVNA